AGRWGTQPTRGAASGRQVREPALARLTPARIVRSDVFPAPFGPRSARASPLRRARSTPSSATTRRKRLRIPVATRSGALAPSASVVAGGGGIHHPRRDLAPLGGARRGLGLGRLGGRRRGGGRRRRRRLGLDRRRRA